MPLTQTHKTDHLDIEKITMLLPIIHSRDGNEDYIEMMQISNTPK
jgi:hypothetical protein